MNQQSSTIVAYVEIRVSKHKIPVRSETWESSVYRGRGHHVPDSFVQSSCFLMSASDTVGLTLSNDFKKSFNVNGGSISSSDSISDHVFSTASGSPGEHGVHLIASGFSSESDGICLKCVAEMTFRTGCMSASRTRIDISEPEYLLQEFIRVP